MKHLIFFLVNDRRQEMIASSIDSALQISAVFGLFTMDEIVKIEETEAELN